MRVLMLGVNHRTAAVELRERLTLAGDRLAGVIDKLRASHPALEVVILSTCNRTEVYLARPAHEPPTVEDLITFLAAESAVERPAVAAATIHRENEQAILQLFRVTTGLESMVLGEPQILGQVKRAYEFATQRGSVGPVLHKVFQQAMAVGKHARTATGIGAGRLSVGSVAVDLAKQVFERFDDKTVVCIGAGEMAKLTLKHFHALRPAKLWLTNRSPDKAQALATSIGLGGENGGARTFEALNDLLVEADVVLSGTGSALPIITAERFRPLLKRRRSRPLFIIDIALPRDVEPEVGTMKNTYLYNIDHLQAVVEQTRGQRSDEVVACEAILADAVSACMAEIQNRDISHLIRALRDRLHEVARAEQSRTLHKLENSPGANVEALLEEHSHRLINKILHVPLSQLDRRQSGTPLGFYAAALRKLFDVNEDTALPVSGGEDASENGSRAGNEGAPAPQASPSPTAERAKTA